MCNQMENNGYVKQIGSDRNWEKCLSSFLTDQLAKAGNGNLNNLLPNSWSDFPTEVMDPCQLLSNVCSYIMSIDRYSYSVILSKS